MKNKITTVFKYINRIFSFVDDAPLWWAGVLMLLVVMIPHAALGEGSVFTVHDQLDEYMMNNVLTARHPGADTIPEMMGGINASGLTPSAVLFIPLYMFMPPFYAFFSTYVIMILCGFAGMYLLAKQLTDSSILAVCAAGCFCMLPLYPVYGLSQMGIPLVFYAFLQLYRRQRRAISLLLILFFGLTSHLVYTGYTVLGFAGLVCIGMMIHSALGKGEKKANSALWMWIGFLTLLVTYIVTNYRLFAEILFGQSSYVSHREEMVNSAMPFARTVWEVFTTSSQHAFTYQQKLVLPIFLILAAGGVFYGKLKPAARKRFGMAVGGFILLFLIAVFYGICKSTPVVNWKNSMTGFLHYFQAERVYWLYPAGWYLELALTFSFWWPRRKDGSGDAPDGEKDKTVQENAWRWEGLMPVLCLAMLVAVLLPTANTILYNSYFYRNVNQYNNGSGITGYISWESYYAEDLMSKLEKKIGRNMSDYRVAHLGISPAPALMHGFYTVDGYSNNYPLDYKHAFRRAIAGELDKAPETAVYFDKWGNRCYLFNSLTGNYWMLEKDSDVQYEGLDFDMNALAELGCEYLFSGGEIVDAERMGLDFMGYFETEKSYWGIWLYRLDR